MASRQIIVYQGRGGTQYFDASTPELWAKSCIEIIRRMQSNALLNAVVVGEAPVAVVAALLPEPYKSMAQRDNYDNQRLYEERRDRAACVESLLQVLAKGDVTCHTLGAGRSTRSIPDAWDLLESFGGQVGTMVMLDDMWVGDSTGAV